MQNPLVKLKAIYRQVHKEENVPNHPDRRRTEGQTYRKTSTVSWTPPNPSSSGNSEARVPSMELGDEERTHVRHDQLEHDGAEPLQAVIRAARSYYNHSDYTVGPAPIYSKVHTVPQTSTVTLVNGFEKIQLDREDETHVPESAPTDEEQRIRAWTWILQSMEKLYEKKEDGDTCLHLAVINGDFQTFGSIIQNTYIQGCLDLQNNLGQTALHLAVAGDQLDFIRPLLLCGASLTVQDCEGRTPLHIACVKRDLQAVHLLTEPLAGGDMKIVDTKYQIQRQQIPQPGDINNYDGEPCTWTAVKCGHLDIVKHLVKCGHNLNAQELKSGKTILHLAIESNNIQMVDFLLREKRLDPNIEDYMGYNALILAHYHPTALKVVENIYPKRKDHLRLAFLEMVNGDDDDDDDGHLMNG